MLKAERAKELLDYNPKTGAFRWRIDLCNGKIKEGSLAGSTSKGYRQIRVEGKIYRAHRLAWLITYGRWPGKELDHVNGIKDDNRIENLREVTHQENLQNLNLVDGKGSSRYIGVSWHKGNRKWRSSIAINGRTKCIGYFDDESKARDAYISAKKQYHILQGY